MIGQQPRKFSVTQVHLEWRYHKQFQGSYFFDSHCRSICWHSNLCGISSCICRE